MNNNNNNNNNSQKKNKRRLYRRSRSLPILKRWHQQRKTLNKNKLNKIIKLRIEFKFERCRVGLELNVAPIRVPPFSLLKLLY